MGIFSELAQHIIKEQEVIIGPVALEQARKVPGLIINETGSEVNFDGNEKDVIESLVEKYRDLFGMASVEVCRDAARTFVHQLPKDKIPPILA